MQPTLRVLLQASVMSWRLGGFSERKKQCFFIFYFFFSFGVAEIKTNGPINPDWNIILVEIITFLCMKKQGIECIPIQINSVAFKHF